MDAFVDILFGHGSDLDALQMASRALAVSLLTLAMIRASGRRSIGQRRPFDACVVVLLGSVLSRAVVGASPFWPTICAGLVLVLVHRAMAMLSVRSPRFETLVSGRQRELVTQGRSNPAEMRKALVTSADLDEAVRKKTGDESWPVVRAVLERDGVVTVQLRR
jgi:uncharacterized membrane protein YcaP (DUF421 family)